MPYLTTPEQLDEAKRFVAEIDAASKTAFRLSRDNPDYVGVSEIADGMLVRAMRLRDAMEERAR